MSFWWQIFPGILKVLQSSFLWISDLSLQFSCLFTAVLSGFSSCQCVCFSTLHVRTSMIVRYSSNYLSLPLLPSPSPSPSPWWSRTDVWMIADSMVGYLPLSPSLPLSLCPVISTIETRNLWQGSAFLWLLSHTRSAWYLNPEPRADWKEYNHTCVIMIK